MKSKLALKAYIVAAWIAAVICHTPPAALSQGTAFTYQGRIDDGANPANGSFDMRFALFDAASAGVAQGNPLTNAAAAVSNGLFTVTLDFGNQFPGANRWLEIAVRTNGSGAFTTLTPRQALTPAPYAVFAGKVNASGISGTLAPGNFANGTITSTMLATGAVGSNQLAAGAVTTTALANGAVTATKVAMVTNWFALTIANPTPGAFDADNFGNAVAAVGSDRVLIGAKRDDTGRTGAGAAYLFSTDGTLLTTFTNPTPAGDDFFGTALAAVGSDRVLISAPFDDTGADNAGAAYLFSTNGTLLASIHNPTPAFNDLFGNAVAAVGSDRVLISAPFDDTGATSAGAAYLFRTNGTLLTTFTNPTPAIGDQFGNAVAAVGNDRVLIGALGDDTGALSAGAAYLFSTNGTLLTTFTNPTPAVSDNFGTAVAALGNDRVLISAPFDGTGVDNAGAAYLFRTNGTLLTTFTNPTPASFDFFGTALAAVGSDRVLIGAKGDNTGATSAGAAYLFSTNGTLLATINNPTPESSDNFGAAVTAVGSDRVLIGAVEDDTGASGAGAAYLFSTETFTDGLVADAVRARSVTTASLEDGAVTAAKIGGVLFPSQIPELNAFNITSGTLAEERLGNNVALLNRSPQSFTGTNHFTQRVGIGTVVSPDASLHIADGSAGAVTANASALLALEGDTNVFIHFLTPDAAFSGILFGSPVNSLDASIRYNFFGGRELIFRAGNNSTRMIILTNGNVGIGTSAPTEKLHVVGNILATGTITPSSDRNVKKNFSPVDPLAMLAKVSALPIQQWTYQAESDGIHHVGPMAQDFHAAFGLGANDVTIATVDADGVALAAIQGLNEKVEAQQTENAKLKAQNESLQKRLEALERSVQALVPPR